VLCVIVCSLCVRTKKKRSAKKAKDKDTADDVDASASDDDSRDQTAIEKVTMQYC